MVKSPGRSLFPVIVPLALSCHAPYRFPVSPGNYTVTNVVSGKIGPMMEHTDFGYVKASQVIEYDPEAEKLLPVTNGDLNIKAIRHRSALNT
jgi:hypothetical protein